MCATALAGRGDDAKSQLGTLNSCGRQGRTSVPCLALRSGDGRHRWSGRLRQLPSRTRRSGPADPFVCIGTRESKRLAPGASGVRFTHPLAVDTARPFVQVSCVNRGPVLSSTRPSCHSCAIGRGEGHPVERSVQAICDCSSPLRNWPRATTVRAGPEPQTGRRAAPEPAVASGPVAPHLSLPRVTPRAVLGAGGAQPERGPGERGPRWFVLLGAEGRFVPAMSSSPAPAGLRCTDLHMLGRPQAPTECPCLGQDAGAGHLVAPATLVRSSA